LGADAVGYTMYVGSPRQHDEFRQFEKIRQDCERFGMPLVLWSYPRGAAIDAKGGKGSLYAQDYAARVALELGADIVKLHEPDDSRTNAPAPYNQLQEDASARTQRVVRSAGRTMVLFSGGEKNDDDAAVLRKVEFYMASGANGVMFGRNMWLRPLDQALALTRAVHEIMAKYPR
jgi:class I fructose-bisphosphate aldolase